MAAHTEIMASDSRVILENSSNLEASSMSSVAHHGQHVKLLHGMTGYVSEIPTMYDKGGIQESN